MIDPYRMIVVNIVGCMVVFLSWFVYAYIYPKKKVNLFILLLLISLLPVLSIFRAGTYESGDFNIHVFRIISFYNSLKEGILIPSWAADLNSSYGNPLFIFNYSLPYYVISFFHTLGLSFIDSTKLFLGLTLYLSSITMYFAIREITSNKLAAFIAAIFYVFNPYHLIDVHFRATLGESTVFLIAPLVFLSIHKYFRTNKSYFLILNSILIILLVMAHPLIAICYSILLIFYAIFLGLESKKYKHSVSVIFSLVLGVLSSAYVWSSFLIYSPFMYTISSAEPIFYEFKYLFFSPWRLGFLFQGPNGELAQIIGYTQVAIISIMTVSLFTKKLKRTLKNGVIFWLIIFFSILFIMHPISTFIWKPFPLFWMLLPFGRLLVIVAFCTSIVAAYFVLNLKNQTKNKIIILLVILLTIGYTILNWGHRRVIPEISDNTLIQNLGKSTLTEGKTAYFLNNKWADINNFWFSEPPKTHLEIIEGAAMVKEVERTSIMHSYNIQSKTPIVIRENTLYFPGWTMTANGKQIDIYPGNRGIINAKLPTGNYYIELSYKDIPTYDLLKKICFTLLSILITIFLIKYFMKKY